MKNNITETQEPNVYISTNFLLFGTIFGIIFTVIMRILFHERMINMTWWMEIIISTIASSLASIGMSIFIYYNFLRKIPENTEKKIDELLNARLGYETTNHNAVLSKIDYKSDASKSDLSKQHHQIYHKVEKVHDMVLEERTEKHSALDNMTDEQKKISSSIANLTNLSKALDTLVNENSQLKEKILGLEQKNKLLQRQVKSPRQYHSYDHDFEPEL